MPRLSLEDRPMTEAERSAKKRATREVKMLGFLGRILDARSKSEADSIATVAMDYLEHRMALRISRGVNRSIARTLQ